MNEIRWLRRIAAAAVLAVAGVLLGLDAVHAQEQVPPTTTTTATAPAAADDRDNRWLSGVTLVATLGIGGALCFLVDRDRKGARAAQVAALAGGASDVAPIETPLRTLGVDEAGVDFAIVPAIATLLVGAAGRFHARRGSDEVLTQWEVDKADAVTLEPSSGLAGSVDVRGVASGRVTLTATAHGDSATAAIVVVAVPDRAKVRFSVLGAGLGSVLIALVAVGGGISLAFVGEFTSEIGTLLGVAVGAGAVAAVAAGGGGGGGPKGTPPGPASSEGAT